MDRTHLISVSEFSESPPPSRHPSHPVLCMLRKLYSRRGRGRAIHGVCRESYRAGKVPSGIIHDPSVNFSPNREFEYPDFQNQAQPRLDGFQIQR